MRKSARGKFFRVDYPEQEDVPPQAPVLIRVRHQKRQGPFDHFEMRRQLARYPVTVWYGGPTTKRYAATIIRQLGTWMGAMGRAWAAELVPIAPQVAGHRWPWQKFKWWAKTERKQRALYRLVQLSPVEFKWRKWTV